MVDVGTPTLAAAVRSARATAGLTQEELAERADSSVRAVRNLESGRVTRPHSATLTRIAAALGLDPGGLLDLSRGRTARPAGPAQLPPDAPDLVPREGVERLVAVLGDPAAAAPPVVVLTGPPGMGKTTLAVHLGHRLRDAFPDGQLYVELGRIPPALALEGMLDAVGVTDPRLPPDAAGRAAVWRSRVAGRRLLVVLDDAGDADQVRHLLPGTPGCAVLVTSRRTLAGLPASAYVELPGLTGPEALALLRGVAGADRIDAEPEAAADLVAACGGLPLALRITGARLAARPAWRVGDLADRMAARADRLAELSSGDLRIRDAFAASYRELDDPERRTFRLLGVLDHPEVGTAVAAALVDRPEAATRAVLERLADLHLVTSPRPGRWRLHDLLHAFAAELTRAEDPSPVRAAALGRAVARLAAGAAAARAVLRPLDVLAPPGPPQPRAGEPPDAMAWFDTEWAGLVRVVEQAADDLPAGVFRLLADGLEYLYVRGAWPAYERLGLRLLALADRPELVAAAHLQLARGDIACRRLDRAARHHELALAGFRRGGSPAGAAAVLAGVAVGLSLDGRPGEALAAAQESFDRWEALGDPAGVAEARHAVGVCLSGVGRYAEADAALTAALAAFEAAGATAGVVRCLNNLGHVRVLAGDPAAALPELERAVALAESFGGTETSATALDTLAYAQLGLGRAEDAARSLERCRALRRDNADRHGEARCLVALAVVADRTGEPDLAARRREAAIALLDAADPVEGARLRATLDRDPGYWYP